MATTRSKGDTDMSVSHAALIIGCSSGIGRATALRLQAASLPVYATARHVDDLSDLVAKGVTTLALDLIDAESMDVRLGTESCPSLPVSSPSRPPRTA
jgi:NADP-dependent 3-hydroxy acid dehydrogenase YdfG